VPTDAAAGKRTLAVRMGVDATRRFYAALVAVAFVMVGVAAVGPATVGPARPWALLGLLALPAAVPPLRAVLGGAAGRELLPVLRDTGRLELLYAVALGIGLAIG